MHEFHIFYSHTEWNWLFLPLHIVKLFIFCYREQEFMARWGNSLSMTFRCASEIWQGGQLSPLLYNVYTDDLNHHFRATGVGCYIGGDWVNSLSYADDVVLLAPTVTTLQTLLDVCRAYYYYYYYLKRLAIQGREREIDTLSVRRPEPHTTSL